MAIQKVLKVSERVIKFMIVKKGLMIQILRNVLKELKIKLEQIPLVTYLIVLVNNPFQFLNILLNFYQEYYIKIFPDYSKARVFLGY